MLQWGHDFAAVEISECDAKGNRLWELLQWGHDFAAVEIYHPKKT